MGSCFILFHEIVHPPHPHRKPHSILRDRKHGGSASLFFPSGEIMCQESFWCKDEMCSPAWLKRGGEPRGAERAGAGHGAGLTRGPAGGLPGEQRPARNLSGDLPEGGSCDEMTKDKQRGLSETQRDWLGHRLRICWKSGPVLRPDVVTHEGIWPVVWNGTHLKGRDLEAYA